MQTLTIHSNDRTQFIDITRQVQQSLEALDLADGIVTLFVPHTTAGLTINENADPDVTADMEKVLDRIVPWTADYAHCEGNTAAHVKTSMMGSSLQVIVENGKLQLGTWQAIYFCEFDGPRTRKVWIKYNRTSPPITHK